MVPEEKDKPILQQWVFHKGIPVQVQVGRNV